MDQVDDEQSIRAELGLSAPGGGSALTPNQADASTF
jgi:hypothetical protein